MRQPTGSSSPSPLSKGASQVLLGVAREREVRRGLRGDAHPPRERRAFLGRGDRTHGAHAGEHHAAAGQGVVEVRPRREGAGRPDDPGDERRSASVRSAADLPKKSSAKASTPDTPPRGTWLR